MLMIETGHRSVVSKIVLNVDVVSSNECLKDWILKVALLPYHVFGNSRKKLQQRKTHSDYAT